MMIEKGYKPPGMVEIWRQELFDHSDPDNINSPSIHVHQGGRIIIKAGGHFTQMHVTEWVAMALREQQERGPFVKSGPVDGPPQWWRIAWHRVKLYFSGPTRRD